MLEFTRCEVGGRGTVNRSQHAPWPKKELAVAKERNRDVLYDVEKVCIINDATVINDRLRNT